MANFIIKGKNSYGKTRSEQEFNLRKDGMKGMNDDNYDRVKYAEKKLKERIGATEGFIDQAGLHRAFEKDK